MSQTQSNPKDSDTNKSKNEKDKPSSLKSNSEPNRDVCLSHCYGITILTSEMKKLGLRPHCIGKEKIQKNSEVKVLISEDNFPTNDLPPNHDYIGIGSSFYSKRFAEKSLTPSNFINITIPRSSIPKFFRNFYFNRIEYINYKNYPPEMLRRLAEKKTSSYGISVETKPRIEDYKHFTPENEPKIKSSNNEKSFYNTKILIKKNNLNQNHNNANQADDDNDDDDIEDEDDKQNDQDKKKENSFHSSDDKNNDKNKKDKLVKFDSNMLINSAQNTYKRITKGLMILYTAVTERDVVKKTYQLIVRIFDKFYSILAQLIDKNNK